MLLQASVCCDKLEGVHLVCLLACRNKSALAAISPMFLDCLFLSSSFQLKNSGHQH